MMLRWALLFAIIAPTIGFSQNLSLRLLPQDKTSYTVESQETTVGADGKQTESKSQRLPISILVSAGKSLQVTSGPIFTRGRSVGKSRVKTLVFNEKQVPANFFICIPGSGVQVGKTWKAPFFGGAPLPAGIHANYKFSKISADRQFAVIDMAVTHSGASEMNGKGQFLVNMKTGLLSSGNGQFSLTYKRPDSQNPQRMVVNSKTTIKVSIRPT